MSTVNKQSLREEFNALKTRFENLCAEGKMTAEIQALFQAMLMLFELLMAVFMEKRTVKDNKNSSIPPPPRHLRMTPRRLNQELKVKANHKITSAPVTHEP